MSRYPQPLADRFAATIRDILARLSAVEARGAHLNSADLVYARLSTVDPAYASGNPLVTVDGDAGLTGPYGFLRSYTPASGDRVLLVPMGATYLVAGRI